MEINSQIMLHPPVLIIEISSMCLSVCVTVVSVDCGFSLQLRVSPRPKCVSGCYSSTLVQEIHDR